MKQFTQNGLTYNQFDGNLFDGTLHAFFTRRGGVSPMPWDSLNLGGTVGDSRENVIENRRRLFTLFNRPVESLFDVWQVHSSDTICTTKPRKLIDPHQKADAIFTNQPNVTLLMRFADCVPIILYDPNKHVIGLVHAGWQGTLKCIVNHAIETVKNEYHVDPANLVAGIGPSIGPDHYEVGENVLQVAEQTFGEEAGQFFVKRDCALYFDLWKTNEYLLRAAGVTNILRANICTACNTADWYSHRAENGKTGRFAAIAALKE